MQQYVVKQSPTAEGIVAGSSVKAKVKGYEPGAILPKGSHLLMLDLPVELPIDFLEFNIKRGKSNDAPVILYDFEITGQFTATVKLYALEDISVPTELFVFITSPVLIRGIPDVSTKVPAKRGRKPKAN